MEINNKIGFLKLNKKDLNLFNAIKLYRFLLKIPNNDIIFVKSFLNSYYNINYFPDEFYRMFMYWVQNNKFNELFKVLCNRNIYDLINYLKSNNEKINGLENIISPIEYFKLPNKQIKFIVELLKKLDLRNDELPLKKVIANKIEWLLRKPNFTLEEYTKIAIKMYLSIGIDNTIDILTGKYGSLDYEIIYYLFSNLNVTNINSQNISIFKEFLFSNKKDPNNNMRLMIEGKSLEMFLNFDYFYNNISYFIEQLGTKLNQAKVNLLLKERYISPRLENPELNGVILQDMISSYYHKYGISDSEKEIIGKNISAYSKLKLKTKSSIIKIDIPEIDDFTFEILALDDVRNLVMGYRAGNCFRINGDAFILFNNFLSNPHMRILSISTKENKDIGMVLLMRNGNVLIAQGIELSKRISNVIDDEKLYKAVQMTIKFIMDKMNNEDDEIVASIIGLTNNNTAIYNHNILPFIINPILINNQYYNGVSNYQGLLDLKKGKTLEDIKLFIPSKFYFDENNKIYRRNESTSLSSTDYRYIEKILISLRYARFKDDSMGSLTYYQELTKKHELYTVCTLNWFITVFQDGFIDTYINSDNPEVIEKYNIELKKIKGKRLLLKK